VHFVVLLTLNQETTSFNRSSWELLQLHPLQINVSFALDGASSSDDNYIRNILKVIIVALGHPSISFHIALQIKL
jgi:hypothetical protein